MKQRLNHCRLLHIHHDQREQLDFTDIDKKFISRNDKKKLFLEISKK